MLVKNVLVIGLGSMGKRRIRILKKIFDGVNIYGVDSKKERRDFCEKEYNIQVASSIDAIFLKGKIDVAFVCASPLAHNIITKVCLENNIHVFSEINLVLDGYIENMELAKRNNVKLFLSSTPFYRKEIQYITDRIKKYKDKINYSYHVGQYLPDWHPWEAFESFFVGDKKTNACREIFAIELPWMIDTFGKVKKMEVLSGKNTSLNIDYKDNYLVLFEHETGHKGMLAVDVMCREAVRKLEVFGENIFLEWSGTQNSLKDKDIDTNVLNTIELYQNIDKLDDYNKNIIENPYIEEVKDFILYIQGRSNPKYSFEKDFYILNLIDKIEKKNMN